MIINIALGKYYTLTYINGFQYSKILQIQINQICIMHNICNMYYEYGSDLKTI